MFLDADQEYIHSSCYPIVVKYPFSLCVTGIKRNRSIYTLNIVIVFDVVVVVVFVNVNMAYILLISLSSICFISITLVRLDQDTDTDTGSVCVCVRQVGSELHFLTLFKCRYLAKCTI